MDQVRALRGRDYTKLKYVAMIFINIQSSFNLVNMYIRMRNVIACSPHSNSLRQPSSMRRASTTTRLRLCTSAARTGEEAGGSAVAHTRHHCLPLSVSLYSLAICLSVTLALALWLSVLVSVSHHEVM